MFDYSSAGSTSFNVAVYAKNHDICNMELKTIHQPKYSKTQLLLRSFFGMFYIGVPHLTVLFFVEIAALYHYLYSTFVILYKGEYPEKSRRFFENFFHWGARLHTRIYNLNDGYPALGLHQRDEYLFFNVPRPESVDRKQTLIRFVFGIFYILLPHLIVFYLRVIVCQILAVVAFFAVLFTGKYPKGMFDFQVETLRYLVRVYMHFFHLYPSYPPFHGKPDEE